MAVAGCGGGESSGGGSPVFSQESQANGSPVSNDQPITNPQPPTAPSSTLTSSTDGARNIEQLTRRKATHITTKDNGTGREFLVTELNGTGEAGSSVWQLYMDQAFYLSSTVSVMRPGEYIPPPDHTITWVFETRAVVWYDPLLKVLASFRKALTPGGQRVA